jgi:transposase
MLVADTGHESAKGDMWRDPLGTEASVPLGTRPWFLMVLEEVPMAIVGGLDLHRKQITFDVLDTVSGEVRRGRISPADRQLFRGWLAGLAGQHVELAVEGCTGWRFVIEECQAAGVVAHLAEPAETAARRGPKRRAKTDRSDAQLLRELLLEGRIPESWIPPTPVLEARALVRLYKDLLDERTGWLQRVHASLFHLGAPDLDVGAMSARLGETPATTTAPLYSWILDMVSGTPDQPTQAIETDDLQALLAKFGGHP